MLNKVSFLTLTIHITCGAFLLKEDTEAVTGGFLLKKMFLKISSIFTGKHVCWSLFLGLQACNFIKKRLQRRCFVVDIAKFLRVPLLKNIYATVFKDIHLPNFFLNHIAAASTNSLKKISTVFRNVQNFIQVNVNKYKLEILKVWVMSNSNGQFSVKNFL